MLRLCCVCCTALPTMDIGEGALNAIFTHYKEVLPSLGGYLTWAGQLDRSRLEKVLSKVGHMEQEVLEERAKVGPGLASGAYIYLCVWLPSSNRVHARVAILLPQE